MPWESRAGTDKRYYTRTKRVDGKLVRTYFGSGPEAEEAARQDQLARELREAKRTRRATTADWLGDCARVTDEFFELVDVVYRAEMVAAGYHYHRGEWRKRRVPKRARQAEEPDRRNRAADEASQSAHETSRKGNTRRPLRRPMPAREPFHFRCGLVRGHWHLNAVAIPDSSRAVLADRSVDSEPLPERCCADSVQRQRGVVVLAGHGRRARPPPIAERSRSYPIVSSVPAATSRRQTRGDCAHRLQKRPFSPCFRSPTAYRPQFPPLDATIFWNRDSNPPLSDMPGRGTGLHRATAG